MSRMRDSGAGKGMRCRVANMTSAYSKKRIGRAFGVFIICACSSSVSPAPSRVDSVAPPPSRVDVEPRTASGAIGDTGTFHVVLLGPANTPWPLQPVHWTTTNPRVAVIDADGHARAVGNGTCQVI